MNLKACFVLGLAALLMVGTFKQVGFVEAATGSNNPITSPITFPVPTPTPSPLGHPTIGAHADYGDSNYMTGSKFTTSADGGTVKSMSVYLASVDSTPFNKYQLAIYTDSNNAPDTLVATSAIGTVQAYAWNSLPVSAKLSPNTSYWLVYNTNGRADNLNNMKMDNGGVGGWSRNGQTFGSFPQSFGAVTTAAQTYSIYASF